jgi:hypothetical protein
MSPSNYIEKRVAGRERRSSGRTVGKQEVIFSCLPVILGALLRIVFAAARIFVQRSVKMPDILAQAECSQCRLRLVATGSSA